MKGGSCLYLIVLVASLLWGMIQLRLNTWLREAQSAQSLFLDSNLSDEGKGQRHGKGTKAGPAFDVSYLRRHPLNLTYFPPEGYGTGICDVPFGLGEEGYRGIWGLQKIRVVKNDPKTSRRVLCIVYTHSNRHHVVKSIAETYGSRCDGFLAASNETDQTIGAVHIPHQGPETYSNMWQKVRSIWSYVFSNYLNEFDCFFIAGDNTFVIAENLIHSCNSIETPHTPVYLGQAQCDRNKKIRYCSGGAGYLLNREALRRLVQEAYTESYCNMNDTRSDEDRVVGNCLRRTIAQCTHSTDEVGQSRFHGMDVHFHATYFNLQPSPWDAEGLKQYHNITATSKGFLRSISQTSVSFHLVRFLLTDYGKSPPSIFADQGLRRYHAIVHNLCPNQDTSRVQPELDCKIRPKRPYISDHECREKLNLTMSTMVP